MPRLYKNLHNRLEPTQLVDSTTDWEALYAQNKKWGPYRFAMGKPSLILPIYYMFNGPKWQDFLLLRGLYFRITAAQ